MRYESTGYRVFNLINILFMILLAAMIVFPYLHVLAQALNEGADSMMGGLSIFPRVPTLENFKTILIDNSTARAAVISVLRVIFGTFIAVVVQFTAAYAFIKKDLFGRNVLLIFLIVPMFFSGGLIPTYILYSKLRLLNNFIVYVIPTAFSFYNMVIIRTYLYTIPESLQESAKLDGANDVTILLKIMVPLSMPILATIALWSAVGHWNDWVTTLYFVTKPRLYTLQYILMQLLKENERLRDIIQQAQKDGENLKMQIKTTPEALKAAQIVITTAPIIMVYPFFQKYFIKGVMIGAIKE